MVLKSNSGVLVCGSLARDPQFRTVGQKQTPLLKLSVRYGSDENRKGKYIEVDVWGNQAIALNGMLKSGDPVIAVGEKIEQREYNGKFYYSINNYGEVFCTPVTLGRAYDGSFPIAEGEPETAFVPESSGGDDYQPIADGEDLPF